MRECFSVQETVRNRSKPRAREGTGGEQGCGVRINLALVSPLGGNRRRISSSKGNTEVSCLEARWRQAFVLSHMHSLALAAPE